MDKPLCQLSEALFYIAISWNRQLWNKVRRRFVFLYRRTL